MEPNSKRFSTIADKTVELNRYLNPPSNYVIGSTIALESSPSTLTRPGETKSRQATFRIPTSHIELGDNLASPSHFPLEANLNKTLLLHPNQGKESEVIEG